AGLDPEASPRTGSRMGRRAIALRREEERPLYASHPRQYRQGTSPRDIEVTVGLDTSVVLRLLVGEPEDQSQKAIAFLEMLARQGKKPVVSDLVVAETYFALQHHYGVPKKDALQALRLMFSEGEIASSGAAAEVLVTSGLASAKPGFVDRLIHRAYTDGGGTMATFESSAKKLPSVRLL
ncbi:MAG TPA: PIN domain-containing protein, partial [Polyangiaceae bacterium]